MNIIKFLSKFYFNGNYAAGSVLHLGDFCILLSDVGLVNVAKSVLNDVLGR